MASNAKPVTPVPVNPSYNPPIAGDNAIRNALVNSSTKATPQQVAEAFFLVDANGNLSLTGPNGAVLARFIDNLATGSTAAIIAANTAAITAALASGGTYYLGGTGTIRVSSWPTGLANSVLVVPSNMTISDGASSIIGPINLYGGMWPNGRAVTDAVVTNGSRNITSATAAFTTADIGKLISVVDPADGTHKYTGTVSAFNSTTSVQCSSANATAGWTSGILFIGTDCATALTGYLANQAAQRQGEVIIPQSIYMLGSGVQIPDGIQLRGEGRQFSIYNTAPIYGTSFVAAAASGTYSTTYVIQVGVTTAKGAVIGSRLEACNVCGMNIAANAVRQIGAGSEIVNSRIQWGSSAALYLSPLVGKVLFNHVSQLKTGYALDLVGIGTQGVDLIILGNYFNGAAGTLGSPTANVRMSGALTGDIKFQNNHSWQESPISSSFPGHNMLITAAGTDLEVLINISGNTFDTPYGHHISIVTAGTSAVDCINIQNNQFMFNDAAYPHNTFDILNVVNAGTVAFLNFGNNVGININNNTISAANMVNPTGAGTFTAWTASGNVFPTCELLAPAGAAAAKFDAGFTNNVRYNAAGVKRFSNNRGRSTQSGNGATVTFNIPHLLDDTPSTWSVVPRVALAAPNFIVTADATNLIVTYATAPPNVASNVDLQWSAGL